MRNHSRSKSSLFLTEIIISILFFSIASACCIQIFVRGHLISEENKNLNHAQNLAASMAETLTASEGNEQIILRNFPDAQLTEESVILYYNKDWESCDETESKFILQTTFQKTADTISGEITVTEQGDHSQQENTIIYKLPFRKHIATLYQKEDERK